ncbi:MAG: cation:proton antiporter [Suilimivivens sp.]
MQILEWIRFIIGAGLLVCGLAIFLIEVYGVFHLDYVLNRMHAAAMGDTLGISFSLIGLMVFCGLNFTTLKLALIVVFLWFASPVSSHMLARLEVATNENLKEHCTVYEDIRLLEKELEEGKNPEEDSLEGRQS